MLVGRVGDGLNVASVLSFLPCSSLHVVTNTVTVNLELFALRGGGRDSSVGIATCCCGQDGTEL
jgi:hypothetical protein